MLKVRGCDLTETGIARGRHPLLSRAEADCNEPEISSQFSCLVISVMNAILYSPLKRLLFKGFLLMPLNEISVSI